ncbi:MAG TPA: hypothetical protein VD837_09840 [Terriglobales bacterium]|nr:hypothetical protein [Terriglobales bacterium]
MRQNCFPVTLIRAATSEIMKLRKQRRTLKMLASLLCFCVAIAQQLPAQVSRPTVPATATAQHARLTVTVLDENGVAVPSAHIFLGTTPPVLHCETNHAGRCTFRLAGTGVYAMRIEKAGFYQLNVPEVHTGQTDFIEVTINHQQEVRETVDVVESQPAIDAERTARTEVLTTNEILNVPYATSRDIRQALPLLPGIVRDQSGNIHVGGASITQTLNLLDGFNIGVPTTSFAELHVSADAVRAIDAETARYSAEHGKGTSVLGLNTGIGDDKLRFSATNFIPSFQLRKGLNLNQWVPRATLSGPIRKGRAWFFLAPDAEYDLTIVKELPDGADRAQSWRASNLAKMQVNITPANILTTELLLNTFHAKNAGLSIFNPVETTLNERATSWMAAIRDQHYFRSGALIEAGAAVTHFSNRSTPLGTTPYVIEPGNIHGSYFETTYGEARRVQGFANVYLAPVQWRGRHDLKFGMDASSINYDRRFSRDSIFMLRADGSRGRESYFPGTPRLAVSNFEGAGYVQDRWSATSRLLVEAGLRLDWDQIIRDALLSPRIAATYMIGGAGETKVSAGLGVFHQSTNLDLIGRSQAGSRLDVFYAADGVTPLAPPTVTRFVVNRSAVEEPRFLNWSIGLEHKLPHAVYARLDFVQKRGNNGFVFLNVDPGLALGEYRLRNLRRDRYNAVTLTLRHTFREAYPVLLAYTRSSARTNAAFDFNPSSPVIGTQQPGALPWDTPNRIVAWGWAPFVKKTTLGYAMEWRDGYPFSAVNSLQQIAGRAQSYRYPDYFTLAVSLERRFHLLGYHLAIRGTIENITNRRNPTSVENNIDAPGFLTFGGTGHRTMNGRIRFLGRSKDKDKAAPTSQNSSP